jgi:alkylhydroperoxidase family enzyme
MGHSEMLLAVAGKTQDEIRETTSRLAGEDLSGFPPAERLVLRFARKLTAEPWSVSDEDMQGLTDAYGRHRALDLVWTVAWGNYMTRVADAFQLPLERTNVFEKPKKPEAASPPAK